MFITVVGNNHKRIADAICDIYKLRKVDNGASSDIEINDEAERDFCMSKEDLHKTCEKIKAYLNYEIPVSEEDFEF